MRQRLPEWLKRGIIDTAKTKTVRSILKHYGLNTVCDSARCPNKNECYCNNTATFMILGDTCTRNCKFCSINKGNPAAIDINEPENAAKAVNELKLDYAVITSVTRDDLSDGGARHFANTIKAIKRINSEIKVEVLTPDFKGDKKLIDIVINAKPDVINHNIETVKRLYSMVRPQADYYRSLEFIRYVKETSPDIHTKSGMMLGLGESGEEIKETLQDLYINKCDIVTVGQYIQPTLQQVRVSKFYTPDEFIELENTAKKIGIKSPIFGALVRSSYKAKETLCGC